MGIDPAQRFTIQSLMDNGTILAHKDGNYGSSYPRSSEFGEEGVPFLTAKLISDAGRIDFAEAPRLAEDKADHLTYGFIESGDVLLSHNATIGRVAVVPSLEERTLIGTSLTYFRVDQTRLLPRYLAAYLSGHDFQKQLKAVMSHSTRNQVPITAQRKISIVVPPIEEQTSIAHSAGVLDDKIEQNRRTARALERLARAIFRAWFMDFEPVKAKATGAVSFPSMPQEIFDALPTRFVDSEIGPVPEGWEVRALGDHCKINERSVRRGEITGEIEYVDIASVTMGRLDGVQRVPFNEAPSRARRRVAHGDTIWSCVRPNRRSYLFIHTPATNRIVSTGFAVLSPSNFGPSFLYMLVTQSAFVDYLVANADGSAYPAVRPEHFASARVLVPPAEAIQAFEMLTMSGRDFIASADRESRQLAKIRDFLLPKLLSDAVRVKEAERLPETTP